MARVSFGGGGGGGSSFTATDLASDTTLSTFDLAFVDASGGARTITMPASPSDGDAVQIVATNTSGGNVIFAANSGQSLSGLPNLQSAGEGAVFRYRASDSTWYGTTADILDRLYDAGSDAVTSQLGTSSNRQDAYVGALDAQSVTIGESVAGESDILIYQDAGTLRAVRDDGTAEVETTSMGSGMQQALNAALQIAIDDTNANGDEGQSRVRIAPGFYDITDVSAITLDGTATDSRCVVDGYGVHLNQTIDSIDSHSLRGLSVSDTPTGEGFRFQKAQSVAVHRDLTAAGCAGEGFVYGGAENAQVTQVTFENCRAIDNGSHGHLLDGSNTSNWVNACEWVSPVSRGNGGNGYEILGTVNYDTFDNLQAENNSDPDAALHIADANELTFIGGHTPSANGAQQSVLAEPSANGTTIIGGRHPDGVSGVENDVRPRQGNQLNGIDLDNNALSGASDLKVVDNNGNTATTVRFEDSTSTIAVEDSSGATILRIDPSDAAVGLVDNNGDAAATMRYEDSTNGLLFEDSAGAARARLEMDTGNLILSGSLTESGSP